MLTDPVRTHDAASKPGWEIFSDASVQQSRSETKSGGATSGGSLSTSCILCVKVC